MDDFTSQRGDNAAAFLPYLYYLSCYLETDFADNAENISFCGGGLRSDNKIRSTQEEEMQKMVFKNSRASFSQNLQTIEFNIREVIVDKLLGHRPPKNNLLRVNYSQWDFETDPQPFIDAINKISLH